jgi:hypothetical protein
LDLLVFSHGRRLGFEFKYGDTPEVTKSMQVAMEDLKLDRLWVVYPGSQSFAMSEKVEAVSILHLAGRLRTFGGAQKP